MKVDCQWFSANLEAYFCDGLDAQQLQMASEHLKTCLSCRSEIQALRNVDPLVKQLLEFRMSKALAGAHAPKRSIGFQLGLAGAAVALVGVLVFVALPGHTGGLRGLLPTNQALVQSAGGTNSTDSPNSPDSNAVKVDNAAPNQRAKPDAPDVKSTGIKPGPEPAITNNSPAFLVTDPAGYSTNLDDYRGRVLFIGVWSAEQPEAAQNIQKLYQSFGNRKEVRILGVTSRNQERPAGMTFPMVFNNGSRLLETRSSDFVIVDKEGNVQMRGSLVGDPNALTTKVRAKLDELGGR
jgi:hypothetical protein